MSEQQTYVSKESDTCSIVALIVLALGLIGAIAYIFIFGKVPTLSEYGTVHEEWSGLQFFVALGIFLNSAIIAFVISKIGSILRKLGN